MLKKLLRTAEPKIDSVFPLKSGVTNEVNVSNKDGVVEIKSVIDISKRLMENQGFMQELANILTENILSILTEKYNFVPTERYQEEIENKKKYINQLDDYLKERKEINTTVENDLQQFLAETTNSLGKALESFSQNINARIHDAENRYGIDAIKNALLTDDEKK